MEGCWVRVERDFETVGAVAAESGWNGPGVGAGGVVNGSWILSVPRQERGRLGNLQAMVSPSARVDGELPSRRVMETVPVCVLSHSIFKEEPAATS